MRKGGNFMKTIDASSHRTPIYRDAGFKFHTIADAEQALIDENQNPQSSSHYIYTRFGNPTVCATEEVLTKLEGCNWSLLTASGMAAIDVALSIFQNGSQTGTWLFFSELYGGTNTYIEEVLQKIRGIQIERFKPESEVYDLEKLDKTLERLKPSLLYFESISNPLLIVPEARQVIKIAKKHGAIAIVDNTFGTPYLWSPLEDNADIVAHSATKYLGGHGNLTAGVVCGNDASLKDQALKYRKFVGSVLSPDDAYRLGSQLTTFELRFKKQCENALRLSQFLDGHDKVSRVLYPGLPTHPTFRQASTLFGGKGSGAMITFDLKGGRSSCAAFVDSIRDRVAYIPTLGDPNSILLHISTVFGRDKYPSEGMIRFSVGCEPYEQLEDNVREALGRIMP
jgi:cystathionine beta-lyase/cystathionine gamma-synthase